MDMLDLMERFRKAYGRGDREGLLASTSADFEWHQHFALDVPPIAGIVTTAFLLMDDIQSVFLRQ